jgi:hypothetical protein
MGGSFVFKDPFMCLRRRYGRMDSDTVHAVVAQVREAAGYGERECLGGLLTE